VIKNRTAIPRNDDDLVGPALIAAFDAPDHWKAIAFTAGFHFAFIEEAEPASILHWRSL
jgi:hypothetical protein